LQSFSNTSLPKETQSGGGQAYPSWAEAEEKYLARTNNVKPKPIEKNADNIVTFDDLSDEQHQRDEVLRKNRKEEFEAMKKKLMKKYEEEDLQEFLASLKKHRQENVTEVGELKSSSPCSDQVELSANLRQEEALLIDSINEENKNDSAGMVNSVIEKAKSKDTCAKTIESKDESFIEQEHGKLSKTDLLDFSGSKGAYLLPCELCPKEVDDHQGHENIAEQCSVDREHQIEESRDPEQQEEKVLENHQEAEQDFVQVMQTSYSTNVFKEMKLPGQMLHNLGNFVLPAYPELGWNDAPFMQHGAQPEEDIQENEIFDHDDPIEL
jgi:hypothetical protein